jgi:hypothetical protein
MNARSAHACDCAEAPLTQGQIAKRAGAIFLGRALAKTATARSGVEYKVEVLRAWKGVSAGDVVNVRSDESTCGIGLPTGSPVLIYATAASQDGQPVFGLSYCGENRVAVGAEIAAEERLLGAPSSEVGAAHLATCPSTPWQLTPAEALAASRSAIFGRVARARTNRTTSITTYEIRSIQMLKGRRGRARRLMLATPSTGCGIALAKGARVLVFLDTVPERFWPDFLKAYASLSDPLPLLSGSKASAAFAALRRSQ